MRATESLEDGADQLDYADRLCERVLKEIRDVHNAIPEGETPARADILALDRSMHDPLPVGRLAAQRTLTGVCVSR